MQCHRRREGRVKQLNPVRLAGRWIGEPFIDGQVCSRSKCGGDIRGVGRWRGQRPVAGDTTDGVVDRLQTERKCVNTIRRGVVEENVVSVFVEAEASQSAG